MKILSLLLATSLAALPAFAADDHFFKDQPGSMRGFLAAKDPLYVKECGSCHFPYSPGLLPARSWERHLERLGKHFGESLQFDPPTQEALRRYLVANAADVSAYEGSKTFMEYIQASQTPYRLREVVLFRTMHRIVLAVIDAKPRIKVRTLTNCNACHLRADEGSFGLTEMAVPGLTPGFRE
jgi:hypothetical protein